MRNFFGTFLTISVFIAGLSNTVISAQVIGEIDKSDVQLVETLFISQAKPCSQEPKFHAAAGNRKQVKQPKYKASCTNLGVVTLQFSDELWASADKKLLDFATNIVSSVVASNGSIWNVTSIVRSAPNRYTLVVVPNIAQTYEEVIPLSLELKFARPFAFDINGQTVDVSSIKTGHDCCSITQPVNANFGNMSAKNVVNSLFIGRVLLDINSPSQGVDQLESQVAKNLPLGFKLLSRTEKEIAVAKALQLDKTPANLHWYFEAIDEHFTAYVIERAILFTNNPEEVLAILADWTGDDAFEEAFPQLSNLGKREFSKALIELRHGDIGDRISQSIVFAGVNDVIRKSKNPENLLQKVRPALIKNLINAKKFIEIAKVLAQKGDQSNGTYSRISVFEAELNRQTLSHKIQCKFGSEYYKNGICLLDGL